MWIIGLDYDHPLIFLSVILHMTEKIRSSKYICVCIERSMDLWYQRRFVALVGDTINNGQGG